MAEETKKMGLIDKVKLFFTAKNAIAGIGMDPKSSWKTGEFWAKVSAAILTVWAGAHGFVPHPIDIYIDLGLVIVISLERLYLKAKHLDTLVDLSSAPALQSDQLAQVLNAVVAKFPKLAFAVPATEKAVEELVAAANAPGSAAPVASPSVSVSVTASAPAV